MKRLFYCPKEQLYKMCITSSGKTLGIKATTMDYLFTVQMKMPYA